MNKYEVVKVIGQGSFGSALLCHRKSDQKKCIIKQISITKLSKKEIKATEQESCILSKLSHPNIVAFWESITTREHLNIVMEFADGGDLTKYIEKRNSSLLPESQVLHLFVQISLAIKHIHDRKILHRDLKTDNIFLTSSGLCKLGDFGVSRILKNTGELASTQIGTPYYMSSEIMQGKKYNSKTDIWSLGVILYELLCLRLPFEGKNMKQLAYNVVNSTPVSPPPIYSDDIKGLVMVMLSKSSKIRPSITSVLARPVIKQRISNFLSEAHMEGEFNHTVLHGHHILAPSSAVAQPNPMPQQQPSQQPKPAVVLRKIEAQQQPSPNINEQHLLKQQRERLAVLQKQREQMLQNLAQPLKRDAIPDVYDQIARYKNQGKVLDVPSPAPVIKPRRVESALPVQDNKRPIGEPFPVKSHHNMIKSPASPAPVAVPTPPSARKAVVNARPPIPKQAPKLVSPQNITPSKSPIPSASPSNHVKASPQAIKPSNSPAPNPFAKIIRQPPQPVASPPANIYATPEKVRAANAASPFTPDSLNHRPPAQKPRFELKDNWLMNLESQLQDVKQQMEVLKQADFPHPSSNMKNQQHTPSHDVDIPPVERKKIQVIVSPNSSSEELSSLGGDSSSPSCDHDKKARIFIKGVDKGWLNALEGQMGDLKQQMKHLNLESRRSPSPRLQRFASPSERSHSLQNIVSSAISQHSSSDASSPISTPISKKDLSPADRVKWYTELESKMSDLMSQMDEIKKMAEPPKQPDVINSKYVSPIQNHTRQKLSPHNSNNIPSKSPVDPRRVPVARLQLHQKSPVNAAVKILSPNPSSKAKPSPSSSNRRPSAFAKPAIDDHVVGKAIIAKPKIKPVVEVNSIESKERLESRKQNRDFERADFKEFLRAQRGKAKDAPTTTDSDIIEGGHLRSDTMSPKGIGIPVIDPDATLSRQQHTTSSPNRISTVKSKSPVPADHSSNNSPMISNSDTNSPNKDLKSQRNADRDAMKKMIAEKRMQRTLKNDALIDDDTTILVKEPKYPPKPFYPPQPAPAVNTTSIRDDSDNNHHLDEASISEEVDISEPIDEDEVEITDDMILGGTWVKNHQNTVDLVTAMEYSYLLAQLQEILQLPSTSTEDTDKNDFIPDEEESDDDEAFEESVHIADDSINDDDNDHISQPSSDDDFDESLSFSNHVEIELSSPQKISMDETVFRGIKQGYSASTNDNGDEGSVATLESMDSDILGIHDELDQQQHEIDEVSIKSTAEIRKFLARKLGKNKFEEAFELLSAIDTLVETDEDEEEFLSEIEDILGSDGLPYLELLYKVLSN